jgi:Ca2+-binding EF-hand superfamily protein
MQYNKKVMTVATAILVTAAAGLFLYNVAPALAQEAKGQVMKRLQEADKNKDGLISREEARSMPRLSANFDAIDTNKDNQISQAELVAFRDKSKR